MIHRNHPPLQTSERVIIFNHTEAPLTKSPNVRYVSSRSECIFIMLYFLRKVPLATHPPPTLEGESVRLTPKGSYNPEETRDESTRKTKYRNSIGGFEKFRGQWSLR